MTNTLIDKSRTALVVIDLQQGIVRRQTAPYAPDIVVKNAAALAEALRAEKTAEYREEFLNPYLAAERGYIDDVIDPAETRARLLAGLKFLAAKREDRPPKKHGNGPL